MRPKPHQSKSELVHCGLSEMFFRLGPVSFVEHVAEFKRKFDESAQNNKEEVGKVLSVDDILGWLYEANPEEVPSDAVIVRHD